MNKANKIVYNSVGRFSYYGWWLFTYSFEKLEFRQVTEVISQYCFSEYGKSAIENLQPLSHPLDELDRVRQMLEYLRDVGEPSLGGIVDIRPEVEWVRKGEILSPLQLLRMASCLDGVSRLQESIRAYQESFPSITLCIEEMHPQKDFVLKVWKAIDPEGIVKDSASPDLKTIRSELKSSERKIKRELEKSMGGSLKDHLQDQVYFLRDGRYVLPVKTSSRSQVRGIVHSSSASRATVYMETEGLLSLNDQIRDLRSQEIEEINRILREFSQRILRSIHQIDQTIKALIDFDGLFARARYGLNQEAIIPQMTSGSAFSLIQAKHPLLGKECVPITVRIQNEFRGIIITGPNTGGKTVTLKTVGLLHLMGKCGIPVPAKQGTELGSFDHILADIGDEQSIQQSLSTFSGHLKNIASIVQTITPSSLVLLDELGAGTDPIEGAALALGLIDTLLEKGCAFLVTSHLTPLKLYAYANNRLENAAVEFDLDTLSPTYRLMVGVAGSSNALEIAQRLGLPEEIIQRAKTHFGREFDEVERIIRNLHEEKIQLSQQKEESQHLLISLKNKEHQLSSQIDKLRQKKYDEFLRDFSDMEKELKQLKRSVETILGELRREKKLELIHVEQLNQQLHRMETGAFSSMKDQINELAPRIEQRNEEPYRFHVGEYVQLEGIQSLCQVLEIRDNRVTIDSDGIRLEVDSSRLSPTNPPKANNQSQPIPVFPQIATLNSVFAEIDVRGCTVEEALERVDLFMGSLIMDHRTEGRIIHGKGTGRLAEGIWRALSSDSRIRSYRIGKPQEGGTGVTIFIL